ncbi:MAG: GntR family transcriptional regulator [Microbacterium sp. 69-10]|uniref:GntR family transcriptional regulator n=1 Tax=Microbacterium sp. 69-10 TaxID=1895783 RepID=UPI0009597C6B|nr:GntR family transcriptional regulator [Microbacterium sp. 69-10]OJU41377.1 MAG: GntR family transcriptional regulator [Microbacterium sp. 69-10]
MALERITGLESSRVADALRDDIMLGRREPGSRLIERDIAAALQVSRLPVREAIKALVADGIVVARPRSWAVVREFSVQDLQDFAEVRAAMETLAFVLATQRADEAALARLESIIDAEEASALAGDAVASRQASAMFHIAAVEVADNAMLTELAASLVTRLRWLFGQHDELAEMAVQHRDILRVMRERDVDAIKEMIPAHLDEGRIAAEQRLRARHDENG